MYIKKESMQKAYNTSSIPKGLIQQKENCYFLILVSLLKLSASEYVVLSIFAESGFY